MDGSGLNNKVVACSLNGQQKSPLQEFNDGS